MTSAGLTVLGAGLVAGPAAGVTNGTPADDAEHPFMVALESSDGEQFCGGSIIAADRVLTAAHCVEGEAASRIRVAAGSTRLGDATQVRAVASIDAHPDYTRTQVEDVAVLHLTSPFTFDDRVAPIRLAGPGDESLVDHDSPATTIGWGATSEHGGGSRDLLETDVRIIGDEECAAVAGGDLDPETMICAGGDGDGKDSCYGDSGGPLFVRAADGSPVLAGIVSFGLAECGGDAPGVYAEAAGLRDFIHSSEPGAETDPNESEDVPVDEWDDDHWYDLDEWDDDWC